MANRYQNTAIETFPDNPIRRYVTVKYPQIPLNQSDTYVYTSRGDRFDILASQYYDDPSLWWIISIANSFLPQDSLIPPFGIQIRIPARSQTASIIAEYNILNQL